MPYFYVIIVQGYEIDPRHITKVFGGWSYCYEEAVEQTQAILSQKKYMEMTPTVAKIVPIY